MDQSIVCSLVAKKVLLNRKIEENSLRKNMVISLCHRNQWTRWGSWLNAVEYYARYYASFRDFVNLLDSEESISIEELKDLFGESSIE